MGTDGHDGRTRDLIVRRLLEHGPTTAMDLAGVLGLSGAAVRRHLDALVAQEHGDHRSPGCRRLVERGVVREPQVAAEPQKDGTGVGHRGTSVACAEASGERRPE